MLTNVVWSGQVTSLTGIQFGDNGGQNYITEENGVATATTQVFEIFEISVSRLTFFLDFESINHLYLDLSPMVALECLDWNIWNNNPWSRPQ